jgi:membrane fusion protein (multidrug efflux system)
MTKRMKRMIMLIAVAVVLGGDLRIPGVQGDDDQEIHERRWRKPPQTVSTVKAANQEWQPQIAAVGSLRAVNGADLSLEVSGVVDSDRVQFRRRRAAGQVLLKLRSDDDVAKLQSLQATASLNADHLRSRPEAVQDQAVSQATVRYRRGNLKNAQGAGGRAAGVLDEEDPARAVRRASRHPRRRSRPVSRAPAPSSSPCRRSIRSSSISSCRSRRSTSIKVGQHGHREGRRLQGSDLHRRDHRAINPKVDANSRNVQVRATLPTRPQAACPACTPRSTSRPARRSPMSRCRRPRSRIIPYGDTVLPRRQQGQGCERQAATGRAANLRDHRRDARRSGRHPQGRQAGDDRSSPPARSSCTTARRAH